MRPNSTPEWQAGSLWRRSWELVVACPLQGLDGNFGSPQTTCANFRVTCRTLANHGHTNGIVCLPWRR
jgi:hypothetical protein